MTPIWASRVATSASFDADVQALSARYSELHDAVEALEDVLRLAHDLPESPIDPDFPRVYATRVDYAPLGADGHGRFLVIYHATDPKPSMSAPYRVFTLLTIEERDGV